MANYTVTTLEDQAFEGGTPDQEAADGLSLREAIGLANQAGGVERTIEFANGLSGQTLTLTQGVLEISGNVFIDGDIDGDGVGDITVDGDDNSGVFVIEASGDALLQSLTITGGNATSGGGILVEGDATGLNGGQLELVSSTVSGNYGNTGGGIYVEEGANAEIFNSTISDNSSDNYGGGMSIYGEATVVNTTFHGNSAVSGGGGIDVFYGTLTLINATITGNEGGISEINGNISIANSIIIGNDGPGFENVLGSYSDLGGNVVGSSFNAVDAADVFAATETINNVEAGALADNGGPVETVALYDSVSNPARDVGDEDLLPADAFDLDNDGDTTESVPVDAKGDARVIGTGIDAGAVELICFARGTAIATPDGERRVEHLRIGDRVLTGDGRAVPARWIGRQTVSMRFQMPERLLPVRIRAGALGNGLPARDLTLTADHALLIDGLLINAGALVNGSTIDWVPVGEIGDSLTVYHVETEDHDIILAEGTPSETFIDFGGRRAFDNFDEYIALYGAERTILEMRYPRVSARRLVPPSLKERLAAPKVA